MPSDNFNPLYADDHYNGHLPKNNFLKELWNSHQTNFKKCTSLDSFVLDFKTINFGAVYMNQTGMELQRTIDAGYSPINGMLLH